ncbi:RNA polymerase RpoN-/SigL-like sigma 54 subunit [Keratinibaculum paraultunense]|uniref:RNA polymerase RpoN-/SigL-like sigma 54 subunit n=1 Tax=Keratinibaculum paraultunense TaxID=1278232 RepID=A0A4R3L045_9FIRM|nr:RNA polymerase factor sigma-54 [Keratinibaculum paraultunense]QQY80273.1 RNA polymerase factor sigma-54 [Keratinibaculum paraultunense]TCS90789.1 RNA polymerase RpoN-/SigL-like sigma 54 subunit [Keratinibaculum paraultunense]
MKLGYDLALEQVQKLVMTPELRQAIQLLQFTSQELNEYLEKQIEENPLLELENSTKDYENIDDYVDEKEEIDWKEYIGKDDDVSYRPQVDKNAKEYSFDNFISYSPSLKDELFFQLNVLEISKEERKIGEILIENIDENGYLMASVEQVAKDFRVNPKKVENVLSIIQGFEPTGVGARNLKECLLLQIRKDKNKSPKVEIIINHYLEDIAYNRLSKIAKELDMDIDEVQEACDYIKTLEPKPGRCFSSEEQVKYITPDATIECIDGEYIIILNDVTGPRLNINNFYKELLQKGKDAKATEYLTKKLNSAMWIIKSIEQRRMTIYKVIESILKFQKDFFEIGEKGLKPLTLSEVAEDIEMHESTVSRATNGKYVQTPKGLYELKFFFSSGFATDGGEISSISIKSIIKDLIERENPKKPYSDQKISDILKAKGINISRRTVAKYRDELEIPSSTVRRRY